MTYSAQVVTFSRCFDRHGQRCSRKDPLNDVINSRKRYTCRLGTRIVGANNRVVSTTICTGKGKITNVSPTGANRQNAQYSCTINIYGPVTVA